MLENIQLANREVATEFGTIKFDSKGQTKELTKEQQKKLGSLPGFAYIEEKKAPAKKSPEKKSPAKKEKEEKEDK